ncbi:hypothetical protein P4361_22795 [Fictibacillus sp. B-59209]|uniref:hypothetical protein n=1 Tax=Fictibacillus sp. B-59209 TaxID=3024873 RepID=UPI002E1FB96A|nr:hypothetical protein [Fictibacillus sp. B-59209]
MLAGTESLFPAASKMSKLLKAFNEIPEANLVESTLLIVIVETPLATVTFTSSGVNF